jgi:hypothetical protein
MSSDLMQGTTTVKADGGNMIAIDGSQFMKSTGDEAGVAGGIVSSTFIKESTWILYSFDVKMDGKGACRLSDKKFHNHQNTVNAQGEVQAPVAVPPTIQDAACKCDQEVQPGPDDTCRSLGAKKHECCEKELKDQPGVAGERGYDSNGKQIAASRVDLAQNNRAALKGTCWPDACTVDEDGNPTQLFDFKFKCPKGTPVLTKKDGTVIKATGEKTPTWSPGQQKKYRNLGEKLDPPIDPDENPPTVVNTENCP